MLPAKPFYLVRHGQTHANVEKITAGGEFDSPLTEFGRKQAQTLAEFMPNLPIKPTGIVHSPMSRARDTANALNNTLKLATEEIGDLREHIVGEWEGRPWEDVMPHIKANIRPPGGENKDDFSARVKRVLHNILSRHDDPVMIVAHGGTFFSILHLYEQAYEGSVDNCHLHYFEPHPEYADFPWRIWQFDIEENALIKYAAPFCCTRYLQKTA